MTYTYFLGANSRRGFFSLYHDFPPADDAFLHILKSGPGTGKSGFLRRIGREAEARGLDVHYVLCSGDPDSLDGVYVPAINQAWVDGTAPHVIEPRIFGADSDYVNLGAFFRQPFNTQEKSRLKELNAAYKSRYQTAYRLLAKVESAKEEPSARGSDDELWTVLRALPQKEGAGCMRHRFLSAISCQGYLRLQDELDGYQLLPCSTAALSEAAHEVKRKGWDGILCLSPLDPDRAEAMLIPELKVAFTAFPTYLEREDSPFTQALEELRAAKELHDELEAVYRPHMNFSVLDDYAHSVISRVFN
jgi:hypothetical protein